MLQNLEFEIYKFRQAKQLPGENIPAYFIRLKQLAKYCKFRMVVHRNFKETPWPIPEITLEERIQITKSMELSEVQADIIESANQLTKKTSRREIKQDWNETNRNRSAAFLVIKTF